MITNFKNKILAHKKIIAILFIILIILIIGWQISNQFIRVYIGFPYQTGEIDSIAFDVMDMNAVNKMVIKTKNGETTITDLKLIKKVTNSTMVATTLGVNMSSGARNEIRLYKNDKLIREMRQSGSGKNPNDLGMDYWHQVDQIEVFNEDKGDNYMWIPSFGYGCAYLSSEAINEIEAALNEQGNSYYDLQ